MNHTRAFVWLCTTACLLSTHMAWPQIPNPAPRPEQYPTFGYHDIDLTPPSYNSTLFPRTNTRMASNKTHVFYVTQDSHIAAFEKPLADGAWSHIGELSTQSTVNGAAELWATKDTVWFVDVNMRLKCLVHNSGYWIEHTVYGTGDMRYEPSVNYGHTIYFVCTDNKVHSVTKSGNAWVDNGVLCAQQQDLVHVSSPIYHRGDKVYFYSGDLKVYDLKKVGTTWQCTNWPLNNSGAQVRAGAALAIEPGTDHIFYPDAWGRVRELWWHNNGWHAGYISTPENHPFVRNGSDVHWFEGRLYYAAATNSKVWSLAWNQNDGWHGTLLAPNAPPVHEMADLVLYGNTVPEQYIQGDFVCTHIAYPSDQGQPYLLVEDDRIHDFRPFGGWAEAPMDGDDNHYDRGWMDTPISDVASQTPQNSDLFCTLEGFLFNCDDRYEPDFKGYDCADARYFDGHGHPLKVWYSAPIADGLNYVLPEIPFHVNARQEIFCTVSNSTPRLATRSFSSPPHEEALGKPLTWSDEFDGTTLDLTKWRRNHPWGNHDWHNVMCWYENPNIGPTDPADIPIYTAGGPYSELSNGHYLMHIKELSQPVGFQGNGNPEQDYEVVTSMLNSEDRYEFLTGYPEIRCQAPRGKFYFPAFWLYADTDPGGNVCAWANPTFESGDINIFEMEGDGKTLLSTAFDLLNDEFKWTTLNAVGFRFYQDQYMYGADWTDVGTSFYFNREPYGPFHPADVCQQPKHFILNNSLVPMYARCEDEQFPATYDVDYVRCYDCGVPPNNELQGDRPRSISAGHDVAVTGHALLTLEGRMIRTLSNNEQPKLVLESLPFGAYLLVTHFADGTSTTQKVMR